MERVEVGAPSGREWWEYVFLALILRALPRYYVGSIGRVEGWSLAATERAAVVLEGFALTPALSRQREREQEGTPREAAA